MKLNTHVRCLNLFCLFLLLLTFVISDNSSKIATNIMFSDQNNSDIIQNCEIAKYSGVHNLGNYSESDFYPISINESAIQILSDLTCETERVYIHCRALFTYPSTNTSWVINLPSSYYDATNYYIRRSSTDYYYVIEDEDISITSTFAYTGYDSYWINLEGDPSITEYVYFDIKAPLVDFSLIRDESSISKKSYSLEISRFDETPHSFDGIHFLTTTKAYFSDFEFQAYNLTGGLNENLSQIIEFEYEIIQGDYGIEISIDLNLGFVQNKTDYEYKIIFIKITPPEGFFDNWLNYIFPLLIGLSLGVLSYQYIWKWIFKVQVNIKKTSEILRKGVPFGLILGAILVLVSYALFYYGYGT